MPPHILPSPPPFAASQAAIWIFFFVAGAAAVLAALPWALYAGFKKKTWIPLLVIASGFLTSLSEPMLDMLGHLRWANNLPTAFSNFGIDVPWLIPPCYAAFLGLEAYFCYYMLTKGVTVVQCYMVFAVGGLSDAIMETVGLNLNIYEYYGLQPYTLLKFPYWWGFVNGVSFFVIGFLHWWLVPKLGGWKKLWVLIMSPAGMMMAYFTTAWPHILSINSNLPDWAKWIFTTVTMVACVGLVRFLASFAAAPEPIHNWTFIRMFFYRLMSRKQRDRLDEKMLVHRPGRELTPSVAD